MITKLLFFFVHSYFIIYRAPKVRIIIYYMELGKPDMTELVKVRNGIAGRGMDKKQMAFCNEMHRGSNFTPT